MHFAGGETSAGRSGITWMMFLAVFSLTAFSFIVIKKPARMQAFFSIAVLATAVKV